MSRAKASRPEWADRLEGLREGLGLSQAALAKKLNVSAMAPSRWERGVNEPPAAVFVELGKLAGKRDCWYFWERAGLTKRDVVSVLSRPMKTAKTPKETLASGQLNVEYARPGFTQSVTGKLIALPLFNTTVPLGTEAPTKIQREKAQEIVVAPKVWCPHPEQTTCLMLASQRMTPVVQQGAIFAMDEADNQPEKLVGKMVVAAHDDCGLMVSWLQRFGKTEVLVAENKDHRPYYIRNGDWKIVGRVVWWFSRSQ